MDALASFTDPATGRKPVKAIYWREEVLKASTPTPTPTRWRSTLRGLGYLE